MSRRAISRASWLIPCAVAGTLLAALPQRREAPTIRAPGCRK